MTADCADYEVYRTGKYVPGLMGTLFSFVDKLVSSFAPMVAGVMFSMCGFTDHNPVMGDPVTPGLRVRRCLLRIRHDHDRPGLQPDRYEVLSPDQGEDGRDPG